MKKNLAVIFGGTNTEHEVSIVSARSIIRHLDSNKYTVIPIYITKENEWTYNWQILRQKLTEYVAKTEWYRQIWKIPQVHPLDLLKTHKIQAVFPVMHGPFGEDGTIQGMLEMLHVPYVGSNVLASALCMDKVVQKQLCQHQGLPVTPFTFTTAYEWQNDRTKVLQYIHNKLQYPLFVKPVNQGSSVGVSKINEGADLITSIQTAFDYDTKVIIEQGVSNPREIECSVLGNHQPETSVLGEIIPSHEFYDYDAKYIDGQSRAIIPAKLPEQVAQKIKQVALKAFSILNCSGLARVDFLVNGTTYDIYLNELNTIPGFTQISMYPQLWEATGLPYEQLLDKLIDLAIERYEEQSKRILTFEPKLPWHQQG